jgi:ABC-type transporter Mla subunit MlaD
MTRGRGTASIVASPVLVGAVTTLIVIVAVFLAYNANTGLPFVPTYDLSLEQRSGSNLVRGNEVRIGGFRVGIVDDIRPSRKTIDGVEQNIAIIDMKLDKIVEPLPRTGTPPPEVLEECPQCEGTTALTRQRSALGLKYLELIPPRTKPGEQVSNYVAGDKIEIRNARKPVEFDEVIETFDADTRLASRTALEGFGDALAGRGQSLNEALENLPEFMRHLNRVMVILSDPDTGLDQFFRQIGRASGQVAPVARVQAELFTKMADTFDAINRDPAALAATIEKSPPTLDAGVESFRVQRPFLANFADLSRRLRPAAQELPRSLPTINRALRVGTDILPETVALNRRTARVFRALEDLAEDSDTKLALANLRTTLRLGTPFIRYLAPYQTVCNFWNYFWNYVAYHFSLNVSGGSAELTLLNAANRTQDNRPNDSSDRPADFPADIHAKEAKVSDLYPTANPADRNKPLTRQMAQPYSPAIDAQGNADCQSGQTGYPNGPLASDGRYPPSTDRAAFAPTDRAGGGSHVILDSDAPGLRGPSYTGLPSLRDVDRFLKRQGFDLGSAE